MPPISIVHFNGYSLKELPGGSGSFGDWEKVCWGDKESGLMGRIPTAIYHALICQPKLFIWSTGATQLPSGEYEAEHAYKTAIERKDRFAEDFPAHFQGLMPNKHEFEQWITSISYFECQSKNTATSMEAVVPVIDEIYGNRPGVLYTVTSANHASRALRDALSIWRR